MNKRGPIYVTLILLLSLLVCRGCTLNTETEADTLTLSGGMGGNDTALSAAQSMNISLQEIDDFFFTDAMLLNRLVTHDDSVDIYYVEGNMISTDVIFRKDFAAPITQPDLVANIEGMYTPLRQAVMDGQTVMGMPVYVSSQEGCLAYDLAVYEMCLEEGYTLPNSWLQLLEQIAKWDEALWQQQVSPVNMDARMLVQVSLDYIIAQQQIGSDGAGLSSEDIVTLMDTAYRAAQNMGAHHADQKEHILFWRQGIVVGHSETDGFRTYPLPLWEGDTPLIPLRVCVAFINPYSKKQDAAQEFLAAYYHQMDPMLQMALSPQANQPIENSNAIEQRDRLQETFSWLESNLEEVESASARREIETQLAECKQQLKLAEKNRYLVDEASLAAYGESIQYGVVLTEQLWQDQSVSRLIDLMLQGQMTPSNFCRELERVMQMKEAERG